jgi:hypothetical protein
VEAEMAGVMPQVAASRARSGQLHLASGAPAVAGSS